MSRHLENITNSVRNLTRLPESTMIGHRIQLQVWGTHKNKEVTNFILSGN